MSFYRAVDNTGLIKINFISDDPTAIAMNDRSRHLAAIPCTSPAFMGGYTYPILNEIADGRTYQILKSTIPTGGSVAQLNHLKNLLAQPETVYGYVDSIDLTVVQIDGYDRRAAPLSSYGWNVTHAPKTFKRLKTLNRPFRLWNSFDRKLRVFLVDDDSYSNDDLGDLEPEVVERLLDGAFVISRQLFEDCLDNVVFPKVPLEETRPELMVNLYRSQEYLRQAQFFQTFNARISGPMDFGSLNHDDELWQRPGSLKGEAFVNVAGMCEKLHVDVICTRSALKFEVANTKRCHVLLEPQKAKTSGVYSDLQTMINIPALYQFKDVSTWTKEDLLAKFHALNNDKIMESWFDMSSPFFNSSARFFDQNDVVSLTKWNARAWLMSGRRITESPWLYEQMGYAIAKGLRANDPSKLRFPVPCAVRAQVISQSYASMAGEDFEIERGTARWSEAFESIVVNDLDWLEMFTSHGGHDLDDFFVGYWRAIDGFAKIVVVRSPNDWGEYSIFDYVDGDWYPTFETHQGEIISFPEASSDPELWATRLSEMVYDGHVHYTGLPSQKANGTKIEPEPYAMKHVLHLLENNKVSASCVGANVNARSLWSLSKKSFRPVQLAPMESCIDAGTQGGSLEDTEAVMAEAKDMVQQLIRDPSVKIDEYMWITRFARIFGMDFDRARLCSDSHISRAHHYRIDAARSFIAMVREHAKKLAPNADPQIHRLGKRLLRPAYSTLIDTRVNMVRMQSPGEQELIPGDWGDVHAPVVAKIESYENIVDQYDFVLALYSACLKVPTRSSGKITDQLVMNPHIFPFLLNAMRFYGLAYYLDITPEGKIERSRSDTWDLKCLGCGTSHEVIDPYVVQTYYHYKQLCKSCR